MKAKFFTTALIIVLTVSLQKAFSHPPADMFYRDARFFSTPEVLDLLRHAGFKQPVTCQTIFSDPGSMIAPDPVREGYREGAFIVIHSIKPAKETP